MNARTGRPLKGARPVRELERVTVRLEAETKALLFSLAMRLGLPVYEVVAWAVRELAARHPSPASKRPTASRRKGPAHER